MRSFDEAARTWDDDPQKAQRARRVADAISATIPALSGMDVLEYGSGTGLLGLALLRNVRSITLADSSREMTAVARQKIAALGATNATAIQLDLASGPAPETRFDVLCTLLTLHHIADTGAILRRFHDLLRPGGTLCISDLDAEDGSFHGAGFEGHNGFERERLAGELSASGFPEPRFSTVFEILKNTPAGIRSFPAFLAVARRGQTAALKR
jgi:2-polyprenyl-3-methyl-5-hydroxy-6-metoxy-1,4-benzoquinol methylase